MGIIAAKSRKIITDASPLPCVIIPARRINATAAKMPSAATAQSLFFEPVLAH